MLKHEEKKEAPKIEAKADEQPAVGPKTAGRFVALKHWTGKPFYVDPAHVMGWATKDDHPGMTTIYLSGGQSPYVAMTEGEVLAALTG